MGGRSLHHDLENDKPDISWVHDTGFVRGHVTLRAAHSSTPRLVLKSKK